MTHTRIGQIDFDEWAALARRDPEAFEVRRSRVIEAYIEQAPAAHRQRLRRLQWRVDAARRRAPNPLAACVAIYGMMWDSLAGEHGLAQALRDAEAMLDGRRPSSRPKARILAFPDAPADRDH